MIDLLARAAEHFVDRLSGPMRFRFVLQPLVAATLAALDGLQDAKTGRAPYLWSLVVTSERRELIAQGWARIGKVFVVATVLDVVYQLIVLRFVYIGEALFAAFLLAIAPYLLLRGPVARLARRLRGSA